ncbi:putative RNA-directed DNA polymerase from transposon BS [Trichonephila clavipes]|nr:putative RNA-directed DNA polymerase from transposon BS [Trichonephila clavipes]
MDQESHPDISHQSHSSIEQNTCRSAWRPSFILDPEILGNKHIDNIVFKARKRLNILRYISGRDWGADAGTLRNTYISLIRPIMEYGVPVYCSASVTNLQKLKKVQLSAARIITGLKNTCPRDIVLFEVDLQPLSLRRRACLTKYYNKLRSLDSQNRTSKIGVITTDSGETVPSAKWSLLTLPLVLWNLFTCHNVLTQRRILTRSSSIQDYQYM